MTSTVVVINWNSGDLLRTCIESLLATTTDVEILVIDNASRDCSLDFLTDFYDRVRLIGNSRNRGFAGAVNQAFEWTSTPYVLLLNPDVQVLPGAVQLLEEFMDSHPWAGAAGGYVGDKYLPRAFPTVGALVRENLGRGFVAGPLPSADSIQVDQPAAAALMIRRDAYEGTRFDERFFPAWYEDVDFCLRMKRRGWKIFFVPAAEFIHSGGYSAEALGSEKFLQAYYRNQVRYAEKHFGSLATIAVRASIAAGMIGRMIRRPGQVKACGKVLIGALIGWPGQR
ncbi:MAG TPA: glycosyltransferase family 2 protein [Terriglobia bacterium]|nr:glycosyltransferase family 2 protein [Terriglobia bacterium]